jgi:hypothetical protein
LKKLLLKPVKHVIEEDVVLPFFVFTGWWGGFSMLSVDDRLAKLERSNRRLKRGLLAVVGVAGCAALIAAGDDSAFDNLVVRHKLVVGGHGNPSIVLESQEKQAGIVILDKDLHHRVSLNYAADDKAIEISVKDENERDAFQVHYVDDENLGPTTLVHVRNSRDSGHLTICASPGNKVGVSIVDSDGKFRSKLDRNGVTVK